MNPRHPKSWTTQDIDLLYTLHMRGFSRERMARVLDRSEEAIRKALKNIELRHCLQHGCENDAHRNALIPEKYLINDGEENEENEENEEFEYNEEIQSNGCACILEEPEETETETESTACSAAANPSDCESGSGTLICAKIVTVTFLLTFLARLWLHVYQSEQIELVDPM